MDERAGNAGVRKEHGGRERRSGVQRKPEETCLFASDVVNADSP